MKHLRITARPDPERAPAFFHLLADSPHASEAWLLDWNLSPAEAATLLFAVDGDPVGSVGVHGVDDVNGSAEIGIFVAEDYWGNGYGTEAGRLATDYAFAQHRRHRVVARVFEGNDASARIWETLGFEREGTHRDEVYVNGEYRDVRYYSVLDDEW